MGVSVFEYALGPRLERKTYVRRFTILLLCAILIGGGIYAYVPAFHPPAIPIINEFDYTYNNTYFPEDLTVSPAPEEAAPLTGDVLTVRQVSIALGESAESVTRKLGVPNRIDDTEYDFVYYVYNNDYNRLVFIAIRENLVIGFYTDSIDFSFDGVNYGDELSAVEASFDQTFALDEVISIRKKDYTIKILMDKLVSHQVTGIYVLSNTIEQGEYTDTVTKNIELMVYDLTNSIRVRHGEEILSWSSSAALSARKHSIDMAENRFFAHENLEGKSPGDRIRAEGIAYNTYGENIIGGYGTAILSTHGWFNSISHRNNILHSKFRYLGVGFTYHSDSTYKTYITQNFYR